MNGRYDIVTMDRGVEGWKIKKRTAEAFVRQQPDVPTKAKVFIKEIESIAGKEVRIYYSASVGFFKQTTTHGELEVSTSDFNAHMNGG